MWVLIILIGIFIIYFAVKSINRQKENENAKLLNNVSVGNSNQVANVNYQYDIVGEQSYQRNLKKIAGPKEEESKFFECYAKVSSEPSNQYDRNAIKVEINGLLVGYISKGEAAKLAGKVVNTTVPAVINGGWLDDDSEGSYGVKLAINTINDLG